MKPKPAWWKLYVFAALAVLALFLFPPTNPAIFVLWMVIMYGGIAFWLKSNEALMIEHVQYQRTIVSAPVDEFFDEDRLYLQESGAEIADDNPHEAA